MSEEDRIERVAKALYSDVASGMPGIGWDADSEDTREHYRHMARVAIGAIWSAEEAAVREECDEIDKSVAERSASIRRGARRSGVRFGGGF